MRVTDTNAIAVLRPTSVASVQATAGIRCDGWSQVVGTIRIQPSGAGDIDLRVQFADKQDPDEEDWVTTGLLSVTPNGGEESWSIRTPVAGVRVRLHISVDDTVETTATILRMAETDLAEASPRGVIFSYAALPNQVLTVPTNQYFLAEFAPVALPLLQAGDEVLVRATIGREDGPTDILPGFALTDGAGAGGESADPTYLCMDGDESNFGPDYRTMDVEFKMTASVVGGLAVLNGVVDQKSLLNAPAWGYDSAGFPRRGLSEESTGIPWRTSAPVDDAHVRICAIFGDYPTGGDVTLRYVAVTVRRP